MICNGLWLAEQLPVKALQLSSIWRCNILQKYFAFFSKKCLQKTVWDNPENLCRWSPNVIGETSDTICRLFSMTQNAWGKNLFVKIHCFVLDFEEVQDMQAIESIVSYILQYFETNYHIIAALRKSRKGSYEAVFIINAVSYRTGCCFHDRNSIYVTLLEYLRSKFSIPWNIRAGNSLFFKNDGNHQACYIDLQNMKGNE